MGICCFRDHCHSWMCLWTLPGRSGSCWTQLRSTCTGVWCWRTIATWCPWVSTTSLKGVCVISRLPLLVAESWGTFVKCLLISGLYLEARFSYSPFGIRICWLNGVYFAKVQKGSFFTLPLNRVFPILLNPWVLGSFGPGCLWFSIHRVSTHQTEYHFPVGTRRAVDDANSKWGPSGWVVRTFRSFPSYSELVWVLTWCSLRVCTFGSFVTIVS